MTPFQRVTQALQLRGPLSAEPRARVLHGLLVCILLYLWLIDVPFLITPFAIRKIGAILICGCLTLVYGYCLALLRRGLLRQASWLYLAGSFLIDTAFIALAGGVQGPGLVHYINLPLVAGLVAERPGSHRYRRIVPLHFA